MAVELAVLSIEQFSVPDAVVSDNSNVNTFVLKENEELVGYFEQIINHEKKDCEIAYFGILKEFYGKKYGAYLLSLAIKKCFEQNL